MTRRLAKRVIGLMVPTTCHWCVKHLVSVEPGGPWPDHDCLLQSCETCVARRLSEAATQSHSTFLPGWAHVGVAVELAYI